VLSQIIVDTIEGLYMSYVKPTIELTDIRRRCHAAGREEQGGSEQRPNEKSK
jgi:hypothetical protein